MFNNISIGIQSISSSFKFIHQNKLYHFFLIPAILSGILFIGGIVGLYYLTVPFSAYLLELLSFSFLPAWLAGIIEFLIGFLLRFIAIGFLLSIFRYIILILLSPALAYVAQKTEKIKTGNDTPFSVKQFLSDLWRAFLLAISNGFKQIILVILFSLLGFIPVVGWICPFIIIAIEAYYLGFSLLDYTLEQKKYKAKDTRLFIRKNKTLSIVIGLFFYSLLLIPIFGWMFGPIICVVAGNLAINKKLSHESR